MKTQKLYDMNKVLLLLVCMLGCVVHATYAQGSKVTGKVVDETGEGLPGVSVIVLSTGSGVATDIEGQYTVEVPSRDASIKFSYIGYADQTVKVGAQSVINIALSPDVSELEEVVVIGYGEQSKKDNVGSISNVKFDNVIESGVTESMENMLQGRVAGVNVQQSSGEPGSSPVVIIRGLAAVTRGGQEVVSSPLYVVDGIPILSSATSEFNVTGTSILADIDPNDIEDITILKDASASAIYGSRASNGVILVTTKKGKRGRPQINVNTVTGISMVPQLRPAAGGALERDLKIELYETYNPDLVLPQILSDSLNPYYHNVTNWQKEVYSTGVTQTYNASIRGAGDFGSYSLSVGHFDNKGIAINSRYKRSNMLMNSTLYGLNRKLQINAVVGISRTNNSRRLTLAEPGFTSSLLPAPDSPLLAGFSDQAKYTDRNINNRIRTNLNISLDFLKRFTFKTSGGIDYSRSMRDLSIPEFVVTASSDDEFDVSAESGLGESQNLLVENTLTYRNTFNEKHYLEVLAGQGIQFSSGESTSSYGNTSEQSVSESVNAPQPLIGGSSNYSAYAILSYFSRVSYIFNEKYLINASIRTDGSSKFGENNKWGVFPSAGIGWTFSNEPFLEGLSFLTFGKFRASIGLSGGQFNDDYLSQGILQSAGIYRGQAGFNPVWDDGFKNDELTWEETRMYDFGVDIELFEGRISLEADYYNRLTRGLLLTTDLPNTSGYVSVFRNAADVLNTGYEFTFNTINTQGDFNWTTNLNFAFNDNKVAAIDGGNADIIRDQGRGTIIRVGRSLNGLFFFETNGIYQSDEEVPVDPATGRRLRNINDLPFKAGDKIIVDQNQDYRINSLDRVYAGDPNPDIVGGFSNNFNYKGFDLNILASFVIGRDIVNTALLDRLAGFSAGGNIPDYRAYSIWKQPGDKAFYPSINPWNETEQVISNDTDYIEDGSYFRVQTITLGYNFQRAFLDRFNLRKLRTYVTLNNVALFQSYSGPDAEAVTLSGFDNSGGYPKPRYLLFGLNIGL